MNTTPQNHNYCLLLVDDDKVLSPMVAEYLEGKGYVVHLCNESQKALDIFVKEPIDFCILDVRMPIKGGFELAAELRQLSPEIPFLFLTSESHREKKLEGLRIGADDYILKPFSMEELHLRIQAILKRMFGSSRSKRQINTKAQIGKYIYHAQSRELQLEDELIVLSEIESKLLQLFIAATDGFISREVALKKIWNDDYHAHTRSLNVYVSKLRKILSADPDIKLLNVHGSGYKLIVRPTKN